MQITLPAIRPFSIEVYGVLGTFDTPESNVRTFHFSTLASARAPHTHGKALLRELMPMRERVKPGGLRDLNGLLQRDLNDARVAHELVPYLKGQTGSGVAFFPAILAALMPKGFIAEMGIPYPTPTPGTTADGEPTLDFGPCWSLRPFVGEDGTPLPLGRLTIYPSDTDIVVLDGQHRANAFRYVAGVFGQEKAFYGAFYEGEDPLENFEADLPVTLVWFTRATGEVQPTFISRNLFVDVNTTAKKVNRSRNILLDDRRVPSLLTRFFLSATAQEASFEPGRFSLLHSGFDVDSDLADRAGHALTLTNPDLLEYTLSWLVLGTQQYNGTDRYRVSAEHKRRSRAQFERVFDTDRFNWDDDVEAPEQADTALLREPPHDGERTEADALRRFEAEYGDVLHPVLAELFNEFPLYRRHYEACAATAEWCAGKSTDVREVWSRVFNGGEGLYYTLRYYARSSARKSERITGYLMGVEEVERWFETDRARRFEPDGADASEAAIRRVSQAYDSLRTRAFHVGLVMALDVWRRGDEELRDALPSFLERLRARTPEQWLALLTDVKQELIPNVDPKDWPAYQNLLLRVLQDEGHSFYRAANFGASPDGRIFASRIERAFKTWVDANEDVDPRYLAEDDLPADLLRGWALSARDFVDGLMAVAGVAPLDGGVNHQEEARRVVRDRLRKLKG